MEDFFKYCGLLRISELYKKKIYEYFNYEELVKDHYYVVPMAHETMGSWAPNSLKLFVF